MPRVDSFTEITITTIFQKKVDNNHNNNNSNIALGVSFFHIHPWTIVFIVQE